MNLHQLQQKLMERDFKQTAELLRNIHYSDDKLSHIQDILKGLPSSGVHFSDEVEVLYAQVRALSSYDTEYEKIVLRDLESILSEIIKPTEDSAVIFMEKGELQEAITLYKQAMQSDYDAQLSLGKYYKAIGRDDWAFSWYETAATNGKTDAIYWLGNFYFDGNFVTKSLEKAFYYYKEAALKGHGDAMNNYADMHFRGEYVEKNNERAFELFTIAAKRGVPESMYTLAYLYENGIGTEQHRDKAKYWFTQSALHGDDFAANRLGKEAVEHGDGKDALRWFKMAADREDLYGEFNLGMCYESGIGTQINLKKAKYWYQKAALKGDQEAKAKLKEF
ncbi:tetratricopeptide repeat protein [Oceanobacillus halophilus]|uniref:Sel1 repeat family protein n=1 Tax=Oceanobacillus halophilus TaxID=930130 RepID=A0A495A4A2_9BACI|nr:tetratricopeptide repeat protein [Oceanobacillus halophilus]RKQ34006.1 sel1 repeat family protein [Oceanobacillus halophilus]